MRKAIHLYLIKPTQYDDEGYVVRHLRGVLPSNTLACLAGLTQDVLAKKQLGGERVQIHVFDENVDHVPVERICQLVRKRHVRAIVALVGVQTNQFPRAVDLARLFRRAGISVLIGGFHVSGHMALLRKVPPDIQLLMDEGVVVVKGEVEEAWGDILFDAVNGRLKPMYDYLNAKPDLYDKPIPIIQPKYLRKFVASNNFGTLDCGRGCPFECSFCTIINVQGRKMRFRSADRIAEAIRQNYREHGISFYFFTDDNFARNKNWEAIFDALIRLKAEEHVPLTFMMQVDVLSWKIKNFVTKARRAGCINVFIGMESVNSENLIAAGKRQNHVAEYRQLIEAYRREDITSHVGYIIGFPFDTVESVRRDIQFLMHEVQPDHASFFMLMPLPGSQDYVTMLKRGEWMHPDFNLYDSNHEVMKHPHMKDGTWTAVYFEAWRTFYSLENMKALLARTAPCNYWNNFIRCLWYKNSIETERRHPMMCGFLRLKGRRNRRPIYPILSRWEYARVRVPEIARDFRSYARILREMGQLLLDTRPRTRAEQWLGIGSKRPYAATKAPHVAPTSERLLAIDEGRDSFTSQPGEFLSAALTERAVQPDPTALSTPRAEGGSV